MNVQANKKGGLPGGKHKYPDEHGYEADMGNCLYNPKIFSDLTFGTLRGYNSHHALLFKSNFTAACYAVMRPKGEVI